MRKLTLCRLAAVLVAAAALRGQAVPAAFQQAGSLAAPGYKPEGEWLWQSQWISGKPYSATVSTHTLQTFANGTRVERTETELVYRDALGRTRHETNGGRSITIIDPVAGVEYRYSVPVDPSRAGKKGYSKRDLDTSTLTMQTRAPDRSPLEIATEMAKTMFRAAVDNLGSRTINGVAAQGVRVTTTIPAGTIGNDRDLPVVTERWIATDLQVVVKSVYSDERFGTTTYELTNIVRTPPDAALFQVPAGYPLRESQGPVNVQVHGVFVGTPVKK